VAIRLGFETLIEDSPGAAWAALFERLWPGYRAWYLRGSTVARPNYLACRRALREHMPELVPTWERLVELAGGGDIESRFLSLWCPPPYIAGCSQAVWIDPLGRQEPALLRNYDFAPALLEGTWLATRWLGKRVMAVGDCLWGALDGVNQAGLAAALSFGGRTVSGSGFGIPLVLRYALEAAESTADAIALLRRVPVSMSYSVSLLDAKSKSATVFVAPDRPTEVLADKAVTNFQHRVEWPEHARATRSVERLEALSERLDAPGITARQLADSLLAPPLYQSSWLKGYGTLYSAIYWPLGRRAELFWPGERWAQTLESFAPGRRDIVFDASTSLTPHGKEVP
jgi:predicted choloylglycine hydrolase